VENSVDILRYILLESFVMHFRFTCCEISRTSVEDLLTRETVAFKPVVFSQKKKNRKKKAKNFLEDDSEVFLGWIISDEDEKKEQQLGSVGDKKPKKEIQKGMSESNYALSPEDFPSFISAEFSQYLFSSFFFNTK